MKQSLTIVIPIPHVRERDLLLFSFNKKQQILTLVENHHDAPNPERARPSRHRFGFSRHRIKPGICVGEFMKSDKGLLEREIPRRNHENETYASFASCSRSWAGRSPALRCL